MVRSSVPLATSTLAVAPVSRSKTERPVMADSIWSRKARSSASDRLGVFLPAVRRARRPCPNAGPRSCPGRRPRSASGPRTGTASCVARGAAERGHGGDDREVFGGGRPRPAGHGEGGGDAGRRRGALSSCFSIMARGRNAPRTMAGQTTKQTVARAWTNCCRNQQSDFEGIFRALNGTAGVHSPTRPATP